jgi:hypothetical protein
VRTYARGTQSRNCLQSRMLKWINNFKLQLRFRAAFVENSNGAVQLSSRAYVLYFHGMGNAWRQTSSAQARAQDSEGYWRRSSARL